MIDEVQIDIFSLRFVVVIVFYVLVFKAVLAGVAGQAAILFS